MSLAEAYRRCEEITSAEARNFSYGIRLLPPPKRRAMCALYAMARRIDDIGDGDQPPAAKLAALEAARAQIASVAASEPGDDPVLVALADAARHYHLPMGALDELVEGCKMDVTGSSYETFDDLVDYCRKVAGSIGRLSLAIYGTPDPARAEPLADALGVALQLTNILRDLVEDRLMGRTYLPAEDVERFGASADLEALGDRREPSDALVGLVCFEAARAGEWYGLGLGLLSLLDRRSRACTAAMAGIYRQLLSRIQRDPAAVLRGRLALPGWQKAAVAAQAMLRGAA